METRVGDANDLAMLERAFMTFKHITDRPTLLIVDSHIAYGAPHKQDTSAAHGEPLGADEIRLTKRQYSWPTARASAAGGLVGPVRGVPPPLSRHGGAGLPHATLQAFTSVSR